MQGCTHRDARTDTSNRGRLPTQRGSRGSRGSRTAALRTHGKRNDGRRRPRLGLPGG